MKPQPLRRRSFVLAIAICSVTLSGFAPVSTARTLLPAVRPLPIQAVPSTVGGAYNGQGVFSTTITAACPNPGNTFTQPFAYCQLTDDAPGHFAGFFQQMIAAGRQWHIYDVSGTIFSGAAAMSGTAKLKLENYVPDYFYPATFQGTASFLPDGRRLLDLTFVSTEVTVGSQTFCGVTIHLTVADTMVLGDCGFTRPVPGAGDPLSWVVEYYGGSITERVEPDSSDCAWQVFADKPWIQFSPAGGTGNASVTVTVDSFENTEEQCDRTAVVYVKSQTTTRVLVSLRQVGIYTHDCNDCPVEHSAKLSSSGPESVRLVRRFRDDVLSRSALGRQYTKLYYDHATEISAILKSNPVLLVRAASLLDRLTPVIQSAVDSGNAVMADTDLDDIETLLADVAAPASRALKQAIARARLDARSDDVLAEFGLRLVSRTEAKPRIGASAGYDNTDDLLLTTFAGLGMLRTPEILSVAARCGEYTRVFEAHAGELVRLLASNPRLALRAPGALARVKSAMESVVRHGNATMDEAACAQIDEILAGLEPGASPELHAAIVDVRRDLRSPRALEGFGVRTPPAGGDARDGARLVGRQPLAFVANSGPDRAAAGYSAHGLGYGLSVSAGEMRLSLAGDSRRQAAQLRLRLVGANASAPGTANGAANGVRNYFVGSDPAAWRTNVATSSSVSYHDVYPGVDVVYYGTGRQLEYDFRLEPYAHPEAIRLRAEGVDGARIDELGDLVLQTSAGTVRQRRPEAYQDLPDGRHRVEASYEMTGGRDIAVRVGTYDPSVPLVIDPVLDYASYLGSPSDDTCTQVAVDAAGNIYVAGSTTGAGFPSMGGAQSGFGGGDADAYVVKLDPTGSQIVYATYLGGAGFDVGTGLAVDATGSAYLVGATTSANFPVSGAVQSTLRGRRNAFLTKLTPTGAAIALSTYYGGSSDDGATAIALSGKNIYIAGATMSDDFPSVKGLRRSRQGISDAFIVKFKKGGAKVAFSTVFGGSGFEAVAGMAIDAAGNVCVAGATTSSDMPTLRPVQSELRGYYDGFVMKLNSKGSALVFSTYLGGSELDGCTGIAVDLAGNTYVTGVTASTDFPVAHAMQAAYGGGLLDAFVAKLTPDGSALSYSTYLGGTDEERAFHIAVDSSGRAFTTGATASSNFPTRNALQPQHAGDGFDAYVTTFDATGSIGTSTYLGGTGDDLGACLVVDAAGVVTVAGETSSTDFPVVGSFQGTNHGNTDGFVVRLNVAATRVP